LTPQAYAIILDPMQDTEVPVNNQLQAAWDEAMRTTGLPEKTRYSHRFVLLKFLVERAEPGPVSEATEQDVVIYLTTHARRGSAKMQTLAGLRSFFTWAYEAGHIAENPTRNILG
jgi:site-specific recombinase XerD